MPLAEAMRLRMFAIPVPSGWHELRPKKLNRQRLTIYLDSFTTAVDRRNFIQPWQHTQRHRAQPASKPPDSTL
jgi:hypothetical protein